MRGFAKRFWGAAFLLGFLAFSNGLRADVIEHSGPILEDVVWGSGDEHVITGDVTVYPQVTLTIEAGATIRVVAEADDTAGGNDRQRSHAVLTDSRSQMAPRAKPYTSLPKQQCAVSSNTDIVAFSIPQTSKP